MSESPIPLTVVGGYLGAGKTTLVNRILTGDHGRRLAVIVNDFGDVAVDDALLGPVEGGVRALANGCVCCAAVDGLATALRDIAALEPPPEHLVIEVSGVGDPWAVAQWGRTPGYALDGVVVVADPVHIATWLDDPLVGETVAAQLAAADLVLLSHADDEPAACESAAELVAGLTRGPVLIGTDVSLSVLLGRPSVGVSPTAEHADHAATTFRPRPSDRASLREWLESAPDPVVRAKGFVPTPDGLLIAQRFGHRAEVVRAAQPVDPVMTVVCLGSEPGDAVVAWCARLAAPIDADR